eukprot:TRINITY_DN12128_c0_g1::TRINITY_DN12128_c0_g1_i1::g.26547::m.26547 TRINITY_DN12128_c0_g1::TRINITY_DN12128_c0_g1_i1::g.26547  ORF type:complete len:101 (+),score=0.15,sp/B2GV91/LYRM2_RAT/35.06/4e-06,Complex1_LYR/PF05347.10/3.8e-11,Complex1_LYR_1/PF13232.1/3.8e-11,HxlR/PF01638.12/5.5,HxlR/PF01638.12/1.6 TRINITY_DN12128_c0_g1_i1:32-304(+)
MSSRLRELEKTRRILSLKDFMRRQQVLQLYRSVLRLATRLDESTAHEVRLEARREIERQKQVTDGQKIEYLLSDGKNRLRQLSNLIGFTR